MKGLLGTLAVLAVAYVVISALPDVARYMKMREM
jgi:hypothetical protein